MVTMLNRNYIWNNPSQHAVLQLNGIRSITIKMPKGKQLSDDTIERFVEVVRERPFIYDPEDEIHMDSQKINNVWESITETMNVSGLAYGELNDGISIYHN